MDSGGELYTLTWLKLDSDVPALLVDTHMLMSIYTSDSRVVKMAEQYTIIIIQ